MVGMLKTEKNLKDLSRFVPKIEGHIREGLIQLGHSSDKTIQKIAQEFVDLKRIEEQYDLLAAFAGPLENKKILEIGSGFGLFTAYGNKFKNCAVHGLEPAENEYHGTFGLSQELLADWALSGELIQRTSAENIPHPANSFDLVYSSNVLEHVQNLEKVVQESIRVLKPGGLFQAVVPNYGSFWEGHYCIPWIPYLNRPLAKLYVRLYGKKTEALKDIYFVDYFKLKKILKPYLENDRIEVLSWGEEVFKKRMTTLQFSDWAGLSTVKSWVETAHRLRIIGLVTSCMLFFKAQTPLVLTFKKNHD